MEYHKEKGGWTKDKEDKGGSPAPSHKDQGEVDDCGTSSERARERREWREREREPLKYVR